MMGHSSTDLSFPWLRAALLLSKLLCVNHYINGPQTKPSAESMFLGSCVQLGNCVYLQTAGVQGMPSFPLPSFPFRLPHGGCLPVAKIIEALIQAQWKQWGLSIDCLTSACSGLLQGALIFFLCCNLPGLGTALLCRAGITSFNEAWTWFRQGPCPSALGQGGGSPCGLPLQTSWGEHQV